MTKAQMLELVRREDEEVLKIRKEYLETEAELARIRHASEVEEKLAKIQYFAF
jgi:hypothetical protein